MSCDLQMTVRMPGQQMNDIKKKTQETEDDKCSVGLMMFGVMRFIDCHHYATQTIFSHEKGRDLTQWFDKTPLKQQDKTKSK